MGNMTDVTLLPFISGPFGALNKTLPGYSGYISETLREEQEELREEASSAHVVPRPPIENSYKFDVDVLTIWALTSHSKANIPGYTGYMPTSLHNLEFTQYSRHVATPAEFTSTGGYHR